MRFLPPPMKCHIESCCRFQRVFYIRGNVSNVVWCWFLKLFVFQDFLKMPPKKGRGKKGKDKNLELLKEKQKELQKLWDHFQNSKEYLEDHLNSLCNTELENIKKLYDDKLKALPQEIRKMTLSEYMESVRKSEDQVPSVNDLRNVTSEITKLKVLHSAKKTQKKNKIERQRSTSVSVFSAGKGIPRNSAFPRISRVLSESSLNTPQSKRISYVVTPKFDPSVPLPATLARKPRVGEVVMSLTGSPLLNLANDVAVRILTEDQDLSKLEEDIGKKLNEETKQYIENAKKKLDTFLKA